MLGLCQNSLKILLRQSLELHTNRQSALQLGKHIRGLDGRERSGADEQDVIRLDVAVLGRNLASFDDGQQIPLYTLSGGVTGVPCSSRLTDLVNLIDEYNTLLLDSLNGFLGHQLLGDQLIQGALAQSLLGFFDGHLLPLWLPCVGRNLDHLDTLIATWGKNLIHARLVGHVNGNKALIQCSTPQVLQPRLLLVLLGGSAQERSQNLLLYPSINLRGELSLEPAPLPADGQLHEILDDRIHILSVIANLRKLCGLNLDERGVHQLRQPTSDLSLAHTGWADHQDVSGHDLLAHLFIQLLPTPSVPQRVGHGLLGVLLPHDVLVQIVHHLVRQH
mmetsp:Transcript_25445/g.61540  ORF Transcript_25445/g.61540 Transcript_25445/m.61540 type:complete len:333 (+) Transcript_25445:553-1551(+)